MESAATGRPERALSRTTDEFPEMSAGFELLREQSQNGLLKRSAHSHPNTDPAVYNNHLSLNEVTQRARQK